MNKPSFGTITFALLSVLLAAIAWFGFSRHTPGSPLLITEICTSDTAAYDDNGDYARYIELYNTSDEAVNLRGWGITDENNELHIFTSSDTWIMPGQTILIWRNPYIDDPSSYREGYMPTDLHDETLPLSNGGLYILSDSEGASVDRVMVPVNIPRDKTYATTLAHPDLFCIASPSPHYILYEELPEQTRESIPEPVFSMDGGWYSNPVTVEINCSEGEIHFTTDGSDPDENSPKYLTPLTIYDRSGDANIYSAMDNVSIINSYTPDYPVDKGTVIKAVAINGEKKSHIKSESYFVGLKGDCYDSMPIISISMSPDDLFDYENGIYTLGRVYDQYIDKYGYPAVYDYANYAKEGRGWERPAELEFFSADHKKMFEQKIGIRIHGGWSTAHNQKSFNLYAREEYDGNRAFKYDFFNKSTGNGICNKLMLRNGGDGDMYVTKMRDVLMQSLASERDIGTQRAIPCEVFINGEYWGLYNIQETLSECFIEEHYGTAPGNALIIKNGKTSEDGAKYLKLYEDMVSFAEDNDLSLDENYRKMEELIDIQSCIDFYAVEVYSANADLFSNTALWRAIRPEDDGYNDGRWRWLLYDLDESAGLITGLSDADTDSLHSGHWGDDEPVGILGEDVLFTSLMDNPTFRAEFADTLAELADKNFNYSIAHDLLRSMSDEYRPALIQSHRRFRGDHIVEYYQPGTVYEPPYSEKDYYEDIKVLDDFLKNRPAFLPLPD